MAKITVRRRPGVLQESEEVLTLVQRLLAPLKRYQHWIFLGLGGLLLLSLAWGGYSYWQNRQQDQAAAALDRVRPELNRPEGAGEAQLTALAQISRDYAGTAAAREATLYQAHLLYQGKKYAEAAQAYESLLRGRDPGWDALVAESLSYCYEALGDFQKAAAALEPANDQATGAFQSEVQRRLASLYEQAGKPQEAGRYWQKLLEKPPHPSLVPYLKEKVAGLEPPPK